MTLTPSPQIFLVSRAAQSGNNPGDMILDGSKINRDAGSRHPHQRLTFGIMCGFRCGQHRFRRHTTGIEAIASHTAALKQNDISPHLCGAGSNAEPA